MVARCRRWPRSWAVVWHTVNREIVRWGDALLEADIDRFGQVEAVGVDETLFWRKGRWRKKQWCTSVVDVGGRQLLDIVPGRTAESAASWFRNQPTEWCEAMSVGGVGFVRSLPGGL